MASGTLVDSTALRDIITEDGSWFEWSSSALASAADDGPLFINPIIYAEVSVRFSRIEDVEEALPLSDYGRLTMSWESAFLAGKAFLDYRRNGGARSSALPGFLHWCPRRRRRSPSTDARCRSLPHVLSRVQLTSPDKT
jgi:hypothetical protein